MLFFLKTQFFYRKIFRKPSEFIVAAGDIYRTSQIQDIQIRGVSEIHTHPNQTRTGNFNNNIAILLLESSFPEDHEFIIPIKIWDKPNFTDIFESNVPCKASGWGRTKYFYVRFFFF